jgi:hypothetical protein
VVSPQGARKQGATRAPAPGDLLTLSNCMVNTDFSLVVDSLQYVEKRLNVQFHRVAFRL